MNWKYQIQSFRFFSLAGLVFSLGVHICCYLWPTTIGQMKYVWLIHLIALILAVPTIQSLDILNENASYKKIGYNLRKLIPKSMLLIFYFLLAYTFINFFYTVFYLKQRQATQEVTGKYYAFKNGQETAQEISREQYYRYEGYSTRNASAYWMVFFFLDFLVFSARLKKEKTSQQTMNLLERYKGCFLGLAVGDALGTTLEFKTPGSFTPIKDMVGGGPFRLSPGQWTDDTSMALCLAESLIKKQLFDLSDQLDRYWQWYQHGHLSSTGSCFDIGNTTRAALHRYHTTHNPYSGSTNPMTAGNGSLMRLAPVPLRYASTPSDAIFKAGESSKTTHGAKEAVDACRYMAGLIVGALQGESKQTLLAPSYSPIPNLWYKEPLAPKIAHIANGSFKQRNPPDIQGSGYVVAALEAALWAFYNSSSFKKGALLAVNLGNDADTTGAIYGQIAGAFYGLAKIPPEWLNKLTNKDLIERYAQELYNLAKYDK